MYEFFDHTADLGLRVRATTLDELFAEAGRGLMAMIVEPTPSVPDARARKLELTSERLDWLFCDWLRELLWLTESERVVLTDFTVRVDPRGFRLEAEVSSVPFDPARHAALHEVKAITYHALRVESTSAGWLAEVIVDI